MSRCCIATSRHSQCMWFQTHCSPCVAAVSFSPCAALHRRRCRRYVPDKAYLQSLLAHLATQLPATGPDGLALAAAGLPGLRQPLPSQQWGDAWCAAALAGADGFGPEALAQALPSMAALHMQPPAALMQVRQQRCRRQGFCVIVDEVGTAPAC